jgi:S1-C subfamily serine protease
VTSPFDGYEVEAGLRPSARAYDFDLARALSAVVALESRIPDDAFTATVLGTQRLGNGVVIGADGLVLTIGYLITEAEAVTLTLEDGRRVAAHPLGVDPVTGFGLVQALEPLGLPTLPLGDSRRVEADTPVIIAGAGGRAHAAAGHVLTRMAFAGYWEYLLDEAIITEPAHPHWSGAALIGSEGELIGIGSLSLERQSREGPRPINMFVPIDLLAPILDDLSRGRPRAAARPWLGVFAHDLDGRVVIGGINPSSPASRAELMSGDIILAVADAPVADLADFYARMWSLGPAGTLIPLTLEREGDVFDVEVRSADRAKLLKKPRLN